MESEHELEKEEKYKVLEESYADLIFDLDIKDKWITKLENHISNSHGFLKEKPNFIFRKFAYIPRKN